MKKKQTVRKQWYRLPGGGKRVLLCSDCAEMLWARGLWVTKERTS